jgi:uncharacterized membrane protein YqiK
LWPQSEPFPQILPSRDYASAVPEDVLLLVASLAIAVLTGLGALLVYARARVRVPQGQALVIHRAGGTQVSFDDAVVFPIVQRAEPMSIVTQTITIDCRGKDGVVCRDDIRADMSMRFFVRVNDTHEDVLKVARALGAERASDSATLRDLFMAKFSDAARSVARQLEFEDLLARRTEARDQILAVIGMDLAGFVLEDATFEYLEQTPVAALDPNNVIDAAGIRKITEKTERERQHTARLRSETELELARLAHEARQLAIELERQDADMLQKLRQDTGSALTREQLDDRLLETLRALVDTAVRARLGALKSSRED